MLFNVSRRIVVHRNGRFNSLGNHLRRSQDCDPEFLRLSSQLQDSFVFGDEPVRVRMVGEREEGLVVTVATARKARWSNRVSRLKPSGIGATVAAAR